MYLLNVFILFLCKVSDSLMRSRPDEKMSCLCFFYVQNIHLFPNHLINTECLCLFFLISRLSHAEGILFIICTVEKNKTTSRGTSIGKAQECREYRVYSSVCFSDYFQIDNIKSPQQHAQHENSMCDKMI